MKNNICPICEKGILRKDLFTQSFPIISKDINGSKFTIDNLQCWRCGDCNEITMDMEQAYHNHDLIVEYRRKFK